MTIKLDPDVNALYIRFTPGTVHRTVEVEASVYVDVDDQDTPLGMEFVNADDFLPYLRRHAGEIPIPDSLVGGGALRG